MEKETHLLLRERLKKVVLEIDENGNFYISSCYPAYEQADKDFIEQLLSNTKKEIFC